MGMTVRLPSDALDTLFQVSADAIVGVDARGVVDAWNPAAERLFGLRAEEAMGSPPPAAVLPHPEGGGRPELEVRASRRASGGWVIVAVDRSRLVQRELAAAEKLRDEAGSVSCWRRRRTQSSKWTAAGKIVLAEPRGGRAVRLFARRASGMNVDMLLPDAMRAAHAEHRADYWQNPGTRPMAGKLVLSARRRGRIRNTGRDQPEPCEDRGRLPGDGHHPRRYGSEGGGRKDPRGQSGAGSNATGRSSGRTG